MLHTLVSGVCDVSSLGPELIDEITHEGRWKGIISRAGRDERRHMQCQGRCFVGIQDRIERTEVGIRTQEVARRNPAPGVGLLQRRQTAGIGVGQHRNPCFAEE